MDVFLTTKLGVPILATNLGVPILHIILLLAASTAALLFGRIRLALLVNYLFALYWGYILNRSLFDSLKQPDLFYSLYFGFGVGIALLAALGFFAHRH
jgi:hypothetical protein